MELLDLSQLNATKNLVNIRLGDIQLTDKITDMDIEIEESMLGYSNYLILTFYMPNTRTKQYLENSQPIEVSLNDKIVFNGKIETVTEYTRPPNIIYQIKAIDISSDALKETRITKQYQNMTPESIVSDICSQAGVRIGSLNPSGRVLKSCTFHEWSAKDCLEWLYDQIEYYWFISKNMFNAIPNPISSGNGILISKSSGLLDVDFLSEKNHIISIKAFKVTTELNPSLFTGLIINLESEKVKGSFFILSLRHRRIFQGRNVTEMIVLPIGTTYRQAKIFKLSHNFNITELIKNLITEEMRKNQSLQPSFVTNFNPSELLADVKIGTEPDIVNVSPSLELIPYQLEMSKIPIASPFAINNAGLVFPYSSSMKSILLSLGGKKDDMVLLGSIWDNNNRKPQGIQDGDFRFDLPVNPSQNSQVLIDKDGNIVLKYKSLQIDITATGLTLSRPIKTVGDGEIIINVEAGKTIKLGGAGAIELADKNHGHPAGALLDSFGLPCTGTTGASNSNTTKLKGE